MPPCGGLLSWLTWFGPRSAGTLYPLGDDDDELLLLCGWRASSYRFFTSQLGCHLFRGLPCALCLSWPTSVPPSCGRCPVCSSSQHALPSETFSHASSACLFTPHPPRRPQVRRGQQGSPSTLGGSPAPRAASARGGCRRRLPGSGGRAPPPLALTVGARETGPPSAARLTPSAWTCESRAARRAGPALVG